MVSKQLYKDVYKYSIITMYLLYVIALFGISTVAPEYLHYLTTFIKYYVLLVLIIRFNPWNKFKVDDFDREIVFSFSYFYFRILRIVQKHRHAARATSAQRRLQPFADPRRATQDRSRATGAPSR